MNQTQVLKAEFFGRGMMNNEDKKLKVDINHIPVMITDNGHLLCIPKEKETFHIGITAMTGKGKGIIGNTILGFEHYLNNTPSLILNDFQQETHEMSLPCLNKIFLNNLKVINVSPHGLPIVYLYPSHKKLSISDFEKRFPHLKMSIPTRAIITEIGKYYELGKSEKYITGYIERFLECKDLEEIDEVLNEILMEKFPEKKGEKFEDMKFKISTIFKNIFDEKITDSASPDAPAILNVESALIGKYTNLTVQCMMALGFIPSIQTSQIRNKSWFSAYMAFIVSSLFDDKLSKDSFIYNNQIRMYVPEIDKMWKGENGDLIKRELSLIGTNGRSIGIGMIWDCQDYDSVPDSIRANTPFMFVLRKANSDETRGIVKDFHIDDNVKGQILGLETNPSKGVFECVALTARDPGFVLYNLRTGKIQRSNSPQKGRLITPLSNHKIPGVPLSDLI